MSQVNLSPIVCREMTQEDWKTALQWMSDHYQMPFPADFFPQTGVIAAVDGIDAVVIPVYLEQSSAVAVLGHCVFNTKLCRKTLRIAAQSCIGACIEFAEAKGKKYAVSIFGRRSVNRIADRCGFITADTIEEKFFNIGGK